MQTFTDERTAQPRQGFWIWCSMLGPPLVWLTQFEVIYALAPKTGGGARVATIIVGLAAIVAVLVCAVMSSRYYRLADASPLDVFARKGPRVRFMATLGLMFSALFLLLIVAQLLSNLFLDAGVQ
jgi:uncharacterized membrane protein YuzA (DUF378 family)